MSTFRSPVYGAQFAPSWHRPFLRYIDGPQGGGGGETPPADLGFPANTPLTEMTDAQQAAYWRNESKKQQAAAAAFAKLGKTPDELSAALTSLDEAQRQTLTDNERAVTDARAEGKAEGLREAATTLLPGLVKASVIAHTRAAGETYDDAAKRVTDALEFADVAKFVTDNGELDADKIQRFAASLGTSAPAAAPQGDLLSQVLAGTGQSSAPAGSVQAHRQATYDAQASKK